MPPRRRKGNDAVASPPASPSPAPDSSPRDSNAPSASPSANSSHEDSDPPRFFNTTFTTYRASPLHIGTQALTPARLQLLSRRLRDALVGDVVRGVQVGLESDNAALGRTGALYAVEWRWIDAERILGDRRGDRREGSVELGNESDGPESRTGRRIMCMELRYENARFSALLLPDLAADKDSPGPDYRPSWTWQTDSTRIDKVDQAAFLHLPLLLFRMPAPLKSVIIDFLSSTFDCRIHPLALGTRSLVGSWEAWLSDNGSSNGRRALSKDVLISLGFHIEPPEPKSKDPGGSGEGEGDGNAEDQKQKPEPPQLGLKSIDITIPAADVHRFLRAGEKLDSEPQTTDARKRKADAATTLSDEQQNRRRRKLAGGRNEEGWAWRNQSRRDNDEAEHPEAFEQPFTEALAEYLWHHLGLDMFHPGVRVQRVACDGFALSEGRLKVFAPGSNSRKHRGEDEGEDEDESAVWKLIRELVQKARGELSWGSDVIKGLAV
ncbi:kinetochore complex Sim4 subunit Fta1-domain-containing protein [Jackrogersella minutella]|nr:kinetochore complex Sim4 subunit Fta1-domain-containing protein [Jackrogersella minutella]